MADAVAWAYEADFGQGSTYGGDFLAVSGLYKVGFASARVWLEDDGKTPARGSSGCTRLGMNFTVVGGPCDGSATTDSFNRADSNLGGDAGEKANRDAIGFFRAHLESFGAVREKLDQKGTKKTIDAKWYAESNGSNGQEKGKPRVGFIEFVAKDPAMGVQNNETIWLTKEAYEKKCAIPGYVPKSRKAQGKAATTGTAQGSGKGAAADPDVELEGEVKGGAASKSEPAAAGTTRKRGATKAEAAPEKTTETKASEDPLDAIADL